MNTDTEFPDTLNGWSYRRDPSGAVEAVDPANGQRRLFPIGAFLEYCTWPIAPFVARS